MRIVLLLAVLGTSLLGGDAQRRGAICALLAEENFAEARAEAVKLNAEFPDDLESYVLLAEANLGLGDYEGAEKAAQWMVDMRVGRADARGLAAISKLREVTGDLDGALDALSQAYAKTSAEAVSSRAWMAAEIGRLLVALGRLQDAELTLREAFRIESTNGQAREALADLRLAQGRTAEGVKLLRLAQAAMPEARRQFLLAQALETNGSVEEADAAFTEFERMARAEMNRMKNANRELVYYYTERQDRPGEALAIAEREMARRQDVRTRAAYAWALAANGRKREALAQMELALASGVRDAQILKRAEGIGKF